MDGRTLLSKELSRQPAECCCPRRNKHETKSKQLPSNFISTNAMAFASTTLRHPRCCHFQRNRKTTNSNSNPKFKLLSRKKTNLFQFPPKLLSQKKSNFTFPNLICFSSGPQKMVQRQFFKIGALGAPGATRKKTQNFKIQSKISKIQLLTQKTKTTGKSGNF